MILGVVQIVEEKKTSFGFDFAKEVAEYYEFVAAKPVHAYLGKKLNISEHQDIQLSPELLSEALMLVDDYKRVGEGNWYSEEVYLRELSHFVKPDELLVDVVDYVDISEYAGNIIRSAKLLLRYIPDNGVVTFVDGDVITILSNDIAAVCSDSEVSGTFSIPKCGLILLMQNQNVKILESDNTIVFETSAETYVFPKQNDSSNECQNFLSEPCKMEELNGKELSFTPVKKENKKLGVKISIPGRSDDVFLPFYLVEWGVDGSKVFLGKNLIVVTSHNNPQIFFRR